MRKIWHIARLSPKMDISSAKAFGVLSPIFAGVTPIEIFAQQTIVCRQVLPHASADDLILLAGPPSMLMTLTALWFEQFGVVRFLFWDAGRGRYVEHFLDGVRSPAPLT